MKTRSIRQRLADRLRGLKPQQPNTQMMAAAGWLVTISEDKAKARCLEELRDVKAHMHGRFLTAQDIDGFLRDLPAVQYFDDKQNVIVGNSTEDAAAKVRARLAALNE